MTKKVNVFLIVLFVFIIINLSTVYSDECLVVTSDVMMGGENQIVLRMNAVTNAHGELPNENNYDVRLACDFGEDVCDPENLILALSSSTNAHASVIPSETYNVPVCYDDLVCAYYEDICPIGYDIQMVSLNAETNAHLGRFGDYPIKICCKHPSAPVETVLEWTTNGVNRIDYEQINKNVILKASGDEIKASMIDSSFHIFDIEGGHMTDIEVENYYSETNTITATWTIPASYLGEEYHFTISDLMGHESNNMGVYELYWEKDGSRISATYPSTMVNLIVEGLNLGDEGFTVFDDEGGIVDDEINGGGTSTRISASWMTFLESEGEKYTFSIDSKPNMRSPELTISTKPFLEWTDDNGNAIDRSITYHPGDLVHLVIRNPEGTSVNFQIYEDDLWPDGDEDIRIVTGSYQEIGEPSPFGETFAGTIHGTWTITEADLALSGENEGEYYFYVIGESEWGESQELIASNEPEALWLAFDKITEISEAEVGDTVHAAIKYYNPDEFSSTIWEYDISGDDFIKDITLERDGDQLLVAWTITENDITLGNDGLEFGEVNFVFDFLDYTRPMLDVRIPELDPEPTLRWYDSGTGSTQETAELDELVGLEITDYAGYGGTAVVSVYEIVGTDVYIRPVTLLRQSGNIFAGQTRITSSDVSAGGNDENPIFTFRLFGEEYESNELEITDVPIPEDPILYWANEDGTKITTASVGDKVYLAVENPGTETSQDAIIWEDDTIGDDEITSKQLEFATFGPFTDQLVTDWIITEADLIAGGGDSEPGEEYEFYFETLGENNNQDGNRLIVQKSETPTDPILTWVDADNNLIYSATEGDTVYLLAKDYGESSVTANIDEDDGLLGSNTVRTETLNPYSGDLRGSWTITLADIVAGGDEDESEFIFTLPGGYETEDDLIVSKKPVTEDPFAYWAASEGATSTLSSISYPAEGSATVYMKVINYDGSGEDFDVDEEDTGGNLDWIDDDLTTLGAYYNSVQDYSYRALTINDALLENAYGFGNEERDIEDDPFELIFDLDGEESAVLSVIRTAGGTGAVCGNGIIEEGEECDNDGLNGLIGDCSYECTIIPDGTYCGDDIIQTENGEECDNGNENGEPGNSCSKFCKDIIPGSTYCGDGELQNPNSMGTGGTTGIGDEECDHNDANGLDGVCSYDCILIPGGTYCGDGELQNPNSFGFDEECDDGEDNGKPTSTCSLYCTNKIVVTKYCGDDVVDSPNDYGQYEECDDNARNGLPSSENDCSYQCTLIPNGGYCGDENVDALYGEECDLGNQNGVEGSGCSAYCKNIIGDGVCGDGVTQDPNSLGFSEQCDHGEGNGLDGVCSYDCLWIPAGEYCGDTFVQTDRGEQCEQDDVTKCDEGQTCNSVCLCVGGSTGPVCGNAIIEIGEDCEPSIALTESCESLGLGEGDLECNPVGHISECKHDTSGCTESTIEECGNRIMEGDEECEEGIQGSCTVDQICIQCECFDGGGGVVTDPTGKPYGSCKGTNYNSIGDCDGGDDYITVTWTNEWTWDKDNEYDNDLCDKDGDSERDCYWSDECKVDDDDNTIYHCDSDPSKKTLCYARPKSELIECIGQIKLPFFDMKNLAMAVILLAIMFVFLTKKKTWKK